MGKGVRFFCRSHCRQCITLVFMLLVKGGSVARMKKKKPRQNGEKKKDKGFFNSEFFFKRIKIYRSVGIFFVEPQYEKKVISNSCFFFVHQHDGGALLLLHRHGSMSEWQCCRITASSNPDQRNSKISVANCSSQCAFECSYNDALVTILFPFHATVSCSSPQKHADGAAPW